MNFIVHGSYRNFRHLLLLQFYCCYPSEFRPRRKKSFDYQLQFYVRQDKNIFYMLHLYYCLFDVVPYFPFIAEFYGIIYVVFELFILFLFYYHEIERGVDKIRGNKKCKERYDMFKKVF